MKNVKKYSSLAALGGLLIIAPIATYAHGDFVNPLSDLTDDDIEQKMLDKFDLALEKQVGKANMIITAAQNNGEDTTGLEEIVDEYINMQLSLASINVSEVESEEFEEMFFEFRNEGRELSKEFKDQVKNMFTQDEKRELREELGEGRGHFEQGRFDKERGENHFTQVLSKVLPEISSQLEAEEITPKDAHEALKNYMDSLSDEQREELKDTLDIPQKRDEFREGHKREN